MLNIDNLLRNRYIVKIFSIVEDAEVLFFDFRNFGSNNYFFSFEGTILKILSKSY